MASGFMALHESEVPRAVPRMSKSEVALFRACLAGVERYFEFGVGGSTVMAWDCGVPSVHGIDTDAAWIDEVRRSVGSPAGMQLSHLDIGPIAAWGYPKDRRPDQRVWPLYPKAVRRDADLVLVDGRFRVACLIQTVLACAPSTRILVHDYIGRKGYHVVEPWLVKQESAGSLQVFTRAALSLTDVVELRRLFDRYWKVLG